MTVETLLTLEEFLDLPEKPGSFQELLNGRLIEMAAPRFDHAAVQGMVAHVLLTLLERTFPHLVLGTHTGFVLSAETVQSPDVVLIRRESYRSMETKGGALVGPPELAVEIVSPSESAQDLDDKVSAYLAAGTKTVWVVWPRTRHVFVHHQNGDVRNAAIGGFLDAPDVLPGASIPVASIFPSL
jgi:Uma2 family endonuclease